MIKASLSRRHLGAALLVGLALAIAPVWLAAQETGRVVDTFEHEEHGHILVDSQGMTLYTFSGTEADEEAWPPFTVTSEDQLADLPDRGVSLGTVEHEATGELHVTADGEPLYFFTGDAAPGDATGHDVNGEWSVVQVQPADDDVDAPDVAPTDDDDETVPGPAETGSGGLLGGSSATPFALVLLLGLGAATIVAGARTLTRQS